MKPVVAITGVNASDNPAPGIGVARSLKESTGFDGQVIGLAYDAMEPGIYLDRYVDRAYMIPYPTAGERPLVDRLLYIKAQSGLDVVIPTLDSELPFFLRARRELAAAGIHTFLPTAAQVRLRDKRHLAGAAEAAGIAAPRQVLVTGLDELWEAAGWLGLPLWVKGAMYTARRAYTLQQAAAHYSQVVAEWGYPVIVQQAVCGEELNVIGVGDGEGGAPGLVAIRKMSTTALGKVWTGVTVDHPGVLAAARRFVAATRWRGAFELECIVRDDEVFLIEINPRFPAWVYFATAVGVNLPAMLVRRALGEVVDIDDDYPAGRFYVRYTAEQVCDLGLFQRMVTLGES